MNYKFPDTDPYGVLGLQRGCSTAEVKAAYKKLALQNHPDRAPPDKKEEATARFKVVGEAYEFLRDERNKGAYDAWGQQASGGFPAAEPYTDDLSRKHFGTSPNGVPFTFVWESSADSARRAHAGRRAGRPFGADGFDPFELFNMMFSRDFHSMNANADDTAPFGSRMGGATMSGSIFGDQDPFFQNHRSMANSIGFGFGAPHRGHVTNDPFSGMMASAMGGFSRSFSSSSTSSTFGGFGGASHSTSTRIVNGRKETVTRTVDHQGTETVHTVTPEGETVHVNGVLQAQHPLLGNSTRPPPSRPPLPPTSHQPQRNPKGTATDPIILDSESEPPAPASATFSHPDFGSRQFYR
jgi:DnaJ family protein B protein 6